MIGMGSFKKRFRNVIRIHNKNETEKHFLIKALCLKLLFNRGYEVYSEYDGIYNPKYKSQRIPDIYAVKPKLKGRGVIFIEVETNPTPKKDMEMLKYYEDYNLYIIDVRTISDDINEMKKQIKHTLGF